MADTMRKNTDAATRGGAARVTTLLVLEELLDVGIEECAFVVSLHFVDPCLGW